MKKRIIVLMMLISLIVSFNLTTIAAEAKVTEPTIISLLRPHPEPNGIYKDPNGNVYIIKKGVMQFGWVKYGNDYYYCHSTGTRKYPRGSATRGEMKIIDGRWYAFNSQGKLIKKDYYIQKGPYKWKLSLKIRKNYTVQYVYDTSKCFYKRYSTALRRYQKPDKNNKWRTIEGMQFIPEGWVDWQK